MLTRVNANPGGAVSISGTPIQNATLTASNTLVDADGLGTVTYKWMDGSTVLGTGDSYTLKPTDVDHNIRAEATYVDGEGTTQTVASAPQSCSPGILSVRPTFSAAPWVKRISRR